MGGACEAVAAAAAKGRSPIRSRIRRGAGGGESGCGARRRRAAAGEDSGGRARWRARRSAIREGRRVCGAGRYGEAASRGRVRELRCSRFSVCPCTFQWRI
nr:unnamed protein product [Digitaria exilis]